MKAVDKGTIDRKEEVRRERVYAFADLSTYSLKQRLLIRAADFVFYHLIKFVGWTARFEVAGWEHFEAVAQAGRVPIYAAWHECIYLGVYFWRDRRIVYLTSRSFDGEYIARFLQRFGFGTVRGSSSRGGARALIEMVRLVRKGIPAGFTVDGPRGPRHVAQAGAVMLAKRTGQPILPFHVTAASRWQISSWDRMQLPLPFTRARVEIAPPIYVPPDADGDTLAAKRDLLQSALDHLAPIKIAILGWGSLVWDPRDLPYLGPWKCEGPILPIEFSRISMDGRLTLVIDFSLGQRVRTSYALSPRRTVSEAVDDLRRREQANVRDIGFFDARTGSHSRKKYPGQPDVIECIRNWCARKRIDVCIWTALTTNFSEKELDGVSAEFSIDNAVRYLRHSSTNLENALNYFRKAPPEIDTPLRRRVSVEWPEK